MSILIWSFLYFNSKTKKKKGKNESNWFTQSYEPIKMLFFSRCIFRVKLLTFIDKRETIFFLIALVMKGFILLFLFAAICMFSLEIVSE